MTDFLSGLTDAPPAGSYPFLGGDGGSGASGVGTTPAAPAPSPTLAGRIQNVAGMAMQPMTQQERILALAGRHTAQPQAPNAPLPPAMQPGASGPHQGQLQIGRPLSQFGMFGAGAPRPGQTLYSRPGGNVMQPGGIGGSGPIPAPGYGGAGAHGGS